ncbi:hypothetical protein [Tautonia sociabilis]|uniref:DUF3616 domain-containing protein n=1 Tax=Tautonia sociabilis TaxID=2080755 RepID=A0A432MK67_9BACT|nr:hypothetical protein [Tautonia sociabilis]RUL87650.1 hypothetical protein TsocGM_11620 [Tautonia sociabilis]
MHILLSFRNVRPPSRAALGLFDPASGRFRMALELPPGGLRCDGLGGLALAGRTLWVASSPFRHLGEAEPSLLALRADDLMPEARYRLGGLAGVSALCWHEATLYVLSSGSGEVVAFRADSGRLVDPDDRFSWRPRIAVEGRADPELTDLAFFRNELYASAVDRLGPDAFLFNVTRDAIAARALQDPQSLAVLGDALGYAAGRFGAVHLLGEDFSPSRSAGLEGDCRGLCLADGSAFASSTTPDGRCLLHRLAPDDLAVERIETLPVEGLEVAALLPVEGAGAWPDPPESLWFETFGEGI